MKRKKQFSRKKDYKGTYTEKFFTAGMRKIKLDEGHFVSAKKEL